MVDTQRFLADVGMQGLPFPMRVVSKVDSKGQPTVANISINARIMQNFEARWIDRFIQIVHRHRDSIGTETLRTNIADYLDELKANMVRIDFAYPFFIEQLTPKSKEKCLVQYLCSYSAKASSLSSEAKVLFKIEVPCITTYPGSAPEEPGGLFGQLSTVVIEVESQHDVYPEDLVAIVDEYALSPVYSFLTEEDQRFLIQKIHTQQKNSVVMTDEIKTKLARMKNIDWYAVRCNNYGMLHSYSTVISTEKSSWIPFSGYEEEI